MQDACCVVAQSLCQDVDILPWMVEPACEPGQAGRSNPKHTGLRFQDTESS